MTKYEALDVSMEQTARPIHRVQQSARPPIVRCFMNTNARLRQLPHQ